jgi:beta-fructofuranosidase
MLYRPGDNTRLWDIWLYQEGDQYHMFYLGTAVDLRQWNHIGHVVSRDLIHWERRKLVPTIGTEGAWDHTPTLTGTTVGHQGRYYMFYGADGVPQRIGVMLSNDLDNWRKYEGNPLLEPAPPYYQTALSDELPLWYVDWRDPCVVWDAAAGQYDALICARMASLSPGLGNCIARAVSKDLLHWDLAPPAAVLENFIQAELPDYFEMGGRHYLLFSSVDGRGAARSTPSREWASGIFYVSSDQRHGEYRPPSDPLLLGAGHGRHEGYAGRTIPFEDGRLLYYQIRTQPAATSRFVFGVQILRQRGDGSLEARYWPGYQGLEVPGSETLGFDGLVLDDGKDIGVGRWRLDGGQLVGQSKLVASTILRSEPWSDFHLSCKITARASGAAGVVFRYNPETRQGVVVVLDFGRGLAEINNTRTGWRWIGRTLWDRSTCSLSAGQPAHLRILCRAEFAEVYVDDRWLFSTALQETPTVEALAEIPREGALGFFVEDGEATFSEARLAALAPLP